MGRKRTRPGRTRSLSEEQIQEVLQNYDMECEKQMARIERSAYRSLEAARTQMEARIHKIPPHEYYDMHASPAAAERGRHIPPLAMASMPDMSWTTASMATS
ncbi:hypothetical protein MCAP1_001193 [Malassezia caprae]|uniref:Uncharacterized protein n=1 Tax=Malassezia caprae TaxID=1381934 RepID=A0AAF0E5J9_9BASI|nr:hypothetical protein MCAP1_001193 [Malassezia caprae]